MKYTPSRFVAQQQLAEAMQAGLAKIREAVTAIDPEATISMVLYDELIIDCADDKADEVRATLIKLHEVRAPNGVLGLWYHFEKDSENGSD